MLKYCAFLSLCACAALGQDYITGQGARLVIGQTTFTSQNFGNSNTVFGSAGGLAAGGGYLFLADANRLGMEPINNRVLMFPLNSFPQPTQVLVDNTICPVCVGQATMVLGQTDIQGDVAGLTSQSMNLPIGVCTDGNVVGVADTANNRLLLWREMPVFIGQPADIVLGQPNFTTLTEPVITNASSLRAPQGCWVQSGKLYVADTQDNRIMIWNTIPTQNNQPADLVLGQPNFTTVPQFDQSQLPVGVVNAASMLSPTSVSSDGTHLFVSDLGFDRVLIWNSLPTTNNQPANVEIGQQDMQTATANDNTSLCASNGLDSNGNPLFPSICGATLSFPRFVIPDQYGRLYIADGGNDRVLVFETIPTFNAASADIVLGEPDQYSDVVTSNSSSINDLNLAQSGAAVTPTPTSLAWDGANLYVADPSDFRVLVFTPASPTVGTQGVVNSASRAIYAFGTVTFTGTLTAGDVLTITVGSPANESEGGNFTANSTTNAYAYTVTAADVASGAAFPVGSLDAYDSLITNVASLINTSNNGTGDPNVIASTQIGYGIVQLTARVAGVNGNTITLATSVSTGATAATEVLTTSGGTLSGGGDAATLAPGAIISLIGTNLSDNTASANSNTQLPTQLGGTQVYIDGIPSPLMYVSPTEINVQIPWETVESNSANVYVLTNHNDGSVTVTDAMGFNLAPENPGIYAQVTDSNGNPIPDPRPAYAYHGSSYAVDIVSVDGTINGGDVATIQIQDRIYNYMVQATDTNLSVEDSLIVMINANPQEVVTASAAPAFTRIILQAKVPGPEGDGITVTATQTTTAASGSPAIVLTALNSALCCANVAGAPVTPENPAVGGEFIYVLATGLGLVTPDAAKAAQNDGQPYNGPVSNNPSSPVSALVGGTTATVVSAALEEGTVGIYQVMLQLSSSLASYLTAQVTIAQADFTSNVVTIPVYNSQSTTASPQPTLPYARKPH
jgi:uncharacterized protein (TIGR03437 family)